MTQEKAKQLLYTAMYDEDQAQRQIAREQLEELFSALLPE